MIVDITKPLARGRFLSIGHKRFWISLKYEKLPSFCFQCGVIKHFKRRCSLLKSNMGPDASKQYQYGTWLRAGPQPNASNSNGRSGIMGEQEVANGDQHNNFDERRLAIDKKGKPQNEVAIKEVAPSNLDNSRSDQLIAIDYGSNLSGGNQGKSNLSYMETSSNLDGSPISNPKQDKSKISSMIYDINFNLSCTPNKGNIAVSPPHSSQVCPPLIFPNDTNMEKKKPLSIWKRRARGGMSKDISKNLESHLSMIINNPIKKRGNGGRGAGFSH